VIRVRGKLGTWSPLALWLAEPDHGRDAAAELEEFGYEMIWLGNGPDILSVAETLLAATRTVTVATGILNIWAAYLDELDRAGVRTQQRVLAALGPGPLLAVEQGVRAR
jgi:hypothetical protein